MKYVNDKGIEWSGGALVCGGKRIFNPTPEDLAAAGYEPVEDVLAEPTPTPEELLQQAKDSKIAELEAYDSSEAVNSFSIGGQSMWLTVDERQQIATQISANEAVGRTEMTRWFGGQAFTFPLTAWKQMLTALEVYAGDALNVTENHRADILSLDSIEAVNAYDFTTDYPTKLSF